MTQDTRSRLDAAASESERRRRGVSEMGEDVKHEAYRLVDDARQTVSEATERAKTSGQQYLTKKKKVLADEVGIFSSAIRKASGKLREEDHDAIADYVDAAAEQLDYLRSSFQHKSVSQLLGDAQAVARRRPEIVYGGMFLGGLLAMRFLKATAPAHTQRQDETRGATRGVGRQYDSSRRPGATGGDDEVRSTPISNQPKVPSSGQTQPSSSMPASTIHPLAGTPGAAQPPGSNVKSSTRKPGTLP